MARSQGTLSYGDRSAIEISSRIGGTFTTQTALAALSPKFRSDGQIFYTEDSQRFWKFDLSSSASAGVDVLVPSSGSGRFLGCDVRDYGTALTDATTTIQPTGGLNRVLPAATLTTARSLTLGTTGAVAGMRMRIIRRDVTANAYTIINGGTGAGTIGVLVASKLNFFEAQFDGTDWAMVAIGPT